MQNGIVASIPFATVAPPTCAARLAKLREDSVSWAEVDSGDRLQTSSTLLLPHRLSCSTCRDGGRGEGGPGGSNWKQAKGVEPSIQRGCSSWLIVCALPVHWPPFKPAAFHSARNGPFRVAVCRLRP